MPRGKNKKPRAVRKQKKREVSAMEAYEMGILETVTCPTTTAQRVSDICNQVVEDAIMSFKFLNTAELVWRVEPAQTELHGIVEDLRTELERNLAVIVPLLERVTSVLAEEKDHEDLDSEEVVRRIAPMLEKDSESVSDIDEPRG